MIPRLLPCLVLATALLAPPALAEDAPVYTVTIKDHKFDPAELEVPKATKVKLIVKNLDPTPEEFESHALKREKVVAGNSEVTISIGALQPGRYEFYGEFNQATAQGAIIVKP